MFSIWVNGHLVYSAGADPGIFVREGVKLEGRRPKVRGEVLGVPEGC